MSQPQRAASSCRPARAAAGPASPGANLGASACRLLLALLLPAGAAVAEGVALPPSAASAAAAACGQGLDARQRRLVASKRHQLAFAPQPAPLAVGRHFALDIVVCPGPGASWPLALRVDADMPAHRHGMNYRPTVRALGEGRYRADGLLLHMPGRWRFLFDISVDGRLERLSHEVNVE